MWSRWFGPACLHPGRPWDVTFSPAWPGGLRPCSQARLFALPRLPEDTWELRPKRTSLSSGQGASGERVVGWGQRWRGQSKMGRSTAVQWLESQGCLAYVRTTKPSETRDSRLVPSSASARKSARVTKNTLPSLAYQQHLVFRGHCLCSQQWYFLQEHAGIGCFRELKDGSRRYSVNYPFSWRVEKWVFSLTGYSR